MLTNVTIDSFIFEQQESDSGYGRVGDNTSALGRSDCSGDEADNENRNDRNSSEVRNEVAKERERDNHQYPACYE